MRRSALALLAGLLALSAYADGSKTQSSLAHVAPTPAATDNGDRIATTAWVNLWAASAMPLANGKIWIGSAGGIATPQTPSGDCTISAGGAVTCTQSAGAFTVNGNLTVGGTIIDNVNGITLNSPTGGAKGAGTINISADYYKNNVIIPETVSAPLSLSAGGVVSCPTCVLISGTGRGDAAYTILSTDRYVYTNAAFTLPRTWTLPAANSLAAGTTIWVQDAQGTVTSTNTLTISRAGADTIDIANTTLVITGAGGGITFTTDGVSNWGTPIQTVTTGGTGQKTLTNHGVLLGAGANPVTQLAVGANGTLLLGQTGADPAFNTMSGDITITNAGVTAIGTNKVTRAMEAQGVARSVIGVTGNATANVADIQGTANQFLGVNSAGTALAFQTMSSDATLSGGAITVTKINGVDPLAAWSAYTPTVSCNAGTITTQSQSFRFKNVGKTTYVMGTHTITTVGTCTGTITYSLPSTLTSNNSGPALAVNSGSGALVVALLTAASANFQLFGTPTNTTYQFNFEYENQ